MPTTHRLRQRDLIRASLAQHGMSVDRWEADRIAERLDECLGDVLRYLDAQGLQIP